MCDRGFIAQISWYSQEVVGSPPSTYPLPPNRCGTQSRASRTFGPQQERSWTIAWSARANVALIPKGVQKGSAGQVHFTPASLSTSGMTGHFHPIAIGEPLMTDLVADLGGEWSTN